MTRSEIIEYCCTYPDAIEDYPFDDKNSTIIRHSNNRKWFALIFGMNEKLCINLKCKPMEADFFRRVYNDVSPAWHMNKVHWNTVTINGDVPDEELFAMIQQSFDLTKTIKVSSVIKDKCHKKSKCNNF
ncbi:MAG: MmcQ/YjbR family DNA-binding protein [Oscillospiraceae bacterium]